MGITGQVGAAVGETLVSMGRQVRAVVRNPRKAGRWRERGVPLALADYEDAGALEAAFREVEGVFVMIPPNVAPLPGFPESRLVITAVRNALAAARPPKAVYLSSIGAERESGLGLITPVHLLEEEMRQLSIPGAYLRAAWFMENFAWDLAAARTHGKFFSFLQPLDRAVPMVATADIARTAAETLVEDWNGARTLEIAGPRPYSPRDVAAAWTKVLERPVEAAAVPRNTWQQVFVEQGTPPDRTAYRIEMLDGINSGWIHFGAPETDARTGVIGLEQVLASLVSRQGPRHKA
jgi:NAD(P)H dehydrogenase (quinone)